MDAVILAGSYQWTGSSFEELSPRPLLPVAQRPLVDYVLDWLRAGGIKQTIVCANGSTGALRSYLGEGGQHALSIRYHEDGTPRGAAGCVKDAAVLSSANTLIVADGTSIPVLNMDALLAHHRASGAVLTIAAHQGPNRGGPPSLRPAGIYVFEREVLEAVPATSFQDIKETLIPKLYRAGQAVEVFPVDTLSPRVLDAATYLAVNHWMIARVAASASKESHSLAGKQLVAHPSAWVSPDAIVVGPVMLGAGVRVQRGATIVGPSAVGAGTLIERDAVLARSVTWDNCRIGERSMVDQSLLADNVSTGAGSVLVKAIRSARPERGGRWNHPSAPQTRASATSEAFANPALS